MLKAKVISIILAAVLALSAHAAISQPKAAEATTTTITTNQNFSTLSINGGDTFIINPSATVTFDTIYNHGNIIVMGKLLGNSASSNLFNSGGSVLFLAGSTGGPAIPGGLAGVLTNNKVDSDDVFGAGYVKVDNNADFGFRVSNLYGGTFENWGTINLYAGDPAISNAGNFGNYGTISINAGSFKNSGGFTNYGSLTMANGPYSDSNDVKASIYNRGTINVSKSHSFTNSGNIFNWAGTIGVGFIESGASFINKGGIDNEATFTAGCLGSVVNDVGASFINTGPSALLRTVAQCGSVAGTEGRFDNKGTLDNFKTIDNQGFFFRECNDIFKQEPGSTFTGNAIINNCSTFTPITVMSDTTATSGSLTSASRQFNGEYPASASSALLNKKIDSITLRLAKVGSPTGTAQVGVFDVNLQPKKIFGTIDVATLPTTFVDIEYKLTASDPVYTIVSGDRIGVKYTGGSSTSGVSVMMDRNTSDSLFDGTNSQRVRYETGWLYYDTGEDVYMTLKQTKP